MSSSAEKTVTNLNDCASWPRAVRQAVDATASFIKIAFLLGRERALDSGMDTVKIMAERDTLAHDLGRTRDDIGMFRRRLMNIDPNKRPPYTPEDRFNILQEIRLRGWSLKKAADYYVLHHNTLLQWRRDFNSKKDVGSFFGNPVANKIDDIGRWLVHRLRELFPEPEIGTRTIANMVRQAGVDLSRSSTQRFLRGKKPKKPGMASSEDAQQDEQVRPRGILAPKKKNRTWHMDLTIINLLVVRFHVAALIDGFSRKLLALRVYANSPNGSTVIDLVKEAMDTWGATRSIVVDHGQQFRKQFKKALDSDGDPKRTVIRGRRGDPKFNGKAERFFRTLKLFQRLAFIPLNIKHVQARFDSFRAWYNEHRVNQAVAGRFPEELWKGEDPVPRRKILARDPAKPTIDVRRKHHDNDPFLPKAVIHIDWSDEMREAG